MPDEQWAKIRPLLPPHPEHPRGGRPRRDDRKALEGILWVLRTGGRWCDLPGEYPSPSTCWRRLSCLEERDDWPGTWRAFLSGLDEQGSLDWSASSADGNLPPVRGATP